MLLALGAAAFFFLKMRRYLPERSRAAELAPAETILLVQLPNLRQTALRIPKTDLYQIWREPEVQAFMKYYTDSAATLATTALFVPLTEAEIATEQADLTAALAAVGA